MVGAVQNCPEPWDCKIKCQVSKGDTVKVKVVLKRVNTGSNSEDKKKFFMNLR